MTKSEDKYRDSYQIDIAVIILNYCGYNDTIACVDRICSNNHLDIVIVDNCSPDGSGELLERRYAQTNNIYFIKSDVNGGYAAGNNIGVRFAISRLNPEFICILNNDTLPDADALITLARYLRQEEDCYIVGPVILSAEEGPVIQSAGARINLWTGDVGPCHAGQKYIYSDIGKVCAYVGGACMMYRARDHEVLGEIPECYFLYYEETEWCLRAARKGMRAECYWGSSITHKGSASVSKQRKLGSYLMIRNCAFFEKRNAKGIQRAVFVISRSIKCVVRHIILRRNCIWELDAMMDGIFGRISPEFAYIYNKGS